MGTFKKTEKEEGENTRLGVVPTVAPPSSTYVPVRLERNVVEKHNLFVNFKDATEKIKLAKKCNQELWAIPEKDREKLLKQMGYDKEQIKYYMAGLDYFNDYNNATIAQAESLVRNGAKVEDKELREAMAKSANALAGSILVAYTPYILWKAKKDGSGETAKALAQLEDAHSYVAYTQMFNLYSMEGDINGRPGYVAKTNEDLEDRYYQLLETHPSVAKAKSLDNYRKAADDFYKYYSEYSQKQMADFQGKKEIGETKGLEKAYLIMDPYVGASVPLLMAGLMGVGGPGGFALGALYFGNQAKEAFKSGHDVTGSLISLTLMAPFFSVLRAAPMAAARSAGAVGGVASAGAGLAFQAMMVKDAFGIAFDASRMGWTTQDAAALMRTGGFMAMPLASGRAAKAAGREEVAIPSKKPLKEALWAARDRIGEWFSRTDLQFRLLRSPRQMNEIVEGSLAPVSPRLTGLSRKELSQHELTRTVFGAKPKATKGALGLDRVNLDGEGKDATLAILLRTDNLGSGTVVYYDGSTGKFDKKEPSYSSYGEAMRAKGRGSPRYSFRTATAMDIDILKRTLAENAPLAPKLAGFLAAHPELAIEGQVAGQVKKPEKATSEQTVETPFGGQRLADIGREPRGEIYRNDAAAGFGLTVSMKAKLPQRQLEGLRAFHAAEFWPPWEGPGAWNRIEESAAKESIDLDARLRGSTLVNLGAGRESLKSFLEFAYSHGVKTCVLTDIDLPSKADIKTLMDKLPKELRRKMGIIFIEADMLDVMRELKDGSVNIATSRVMGSTDTAVREDLGSSRNPEAFFAEVGKEITRVVGDMGVAFGVSPQAFEHLGREWDRRGGSGFAIAVKNLRHSQ